LGQRYEFYVQVFEGRFEVQRINIGKPMNEKMVLILGNTHPVRSQLKALGGVWDAKIEGWRLPESKVTEARELVKASGSKKDRVLVTGNTWPIKDELKALGGQWDSKEKGWWFQADKADRAIEMVSSVED
jgi:hypothetical protein